MPRYSPESTGENMTPLKSLRAWPLISVSIFNARIYHVPSPALSWTNPKLGYPAASAVSDSPVEPSSCPTCRFRQEPGGEKQIGPRPYSCKWERQQEDEWLLQPSLAAASQHRTHAAPLIFKGPCTAKGQAQSHNTLVGGSTRLLSPQQGCRALGLAVGVAEYLTPLLQSLDFKATGEEKKPKQTTKQTGSGIRLVPEHLRQCSP